jgi:hypothetical protein
LPCRSPLESIFQLSKPHASYEPLDVIVRSSLPGRMAHSAITSPRVSLARNPTEPLEPPSIRLADPFRPGRMRRIQVCEDRGSSTGKRRYGLDSRTIVAQARVAFRGRSWFKSRQPNACSTLSNSGSCQRRSSFLAGEEWLTIFGYVTS